MIHTTIAGGIRMGLVALAASLLAGPAGAAATLTIEDAAGRAMPATQQHGTARAMAMNSAWVGVAEGTPALQWNPAGLGHLTEAEIGLHHTTGLDKALGETVILVPDSPHNLKVTTADDLLLAEALAGLFRP